jgi:hypothetical protein
LSLVPISHTEPLPNAEVVDRQNVRPPQLEDKQHLNGPPPDSAASGESIDNLLVGKRADFPRTGHGAIDGLGGNIADGGRLRAREAEGSQVSIRDRLQVFGPRESAAGESRQKPSQNTFSRFAVQLLVGHGPD